MIALAYAFLCLVWSTTWHAIRISLSGYPPFLGAAMRFVLSTLLLSAACAIWQWRRGLPLSDLILRDRRSHLGILAAGILNGLGYACIYSAEQTLSGGTTAILCASSPLFALIAARLFGMEPLRSRRMFGLILGLLGVVVLFWDGLSGGAGRLRAMLLAAIAAALIWPLYGALLKRYASHLPSLVSTTYFLMYTAVPLLLMCLLGREPFPALSAIPWQAHLAFLYLTIGGSVVAWVVYVWLLRRLDLSVLSALSLLQPLLALLLDLVLGLTQLRPSGGGGALLVLIGMGLATIRGLQRPAPSPAAPNPHEPCDPSDTAAPGGARP